MRKLIFIAAALLIFSCSKDSEPAAVINPPVVVTKIPQLTSKKTTDVGVDVAFSGGSITDAGTSEVSQRGVCWSTSPDPTEALATKTQDGLGTGDFSSQLTGLAPNTKYYIRAYATSAAGTAYGNQTHFTTHIVTPPVTDSDGNSYETIQIGTQLWMKENLKTTKFCNGDDIPNVTTNAWYSLTTPAWTYYNNDSASNNNGYGKLYNWYAMRDARNVCPCGWHVPTKAEWETMANYLGGLAAAGEAMKSTTGWIQNDWATNSSGFTGLPAGLRLLPNTLLYDKWDGAWWQNSPYGEAKQLHVDSFYLLNPVFDEEVGLSIRCVKD